MNLKEVQDIVNNILYKKSLAQTEIIDFDSENAVPVVNINESSYSKPIPYIAWRVVAVGFVVTTNGVSTEDPQVLFGHGNSDMGTADTDEWLTFTQDATANKQLAVGDCWVYDPYDHLVTPDALANAGTHTYVDHKIGDWESKMTFLTVVRPNDHALGIKPFMLIEVSD